MFSNGYMQFAPDVFPFEWRVSKGALNFWSPSQLAPEPFLFDAFPPVAAEKAERPLAQAAAH